MSHLIKEIDKAYRPDNHPVSWHGLEEAIPGPIVNVSQIPFVAYPVAKQDLLLPPGYQLSSTNCSEMIVGFRPESPIVIATCSPEYRTIGNDIVFQKACEAFEKAGIPTELSFCLTMDNGKKYSYAFVVKNHEEMNINGDEYKLYLNVCGSHDKTMGVQIFGTTTRTVCNNTLQMALKGEKKGINHTFFHNDKGVADFRHLPQLVDSIFADGQRFQELSKQMANFSLAQLDAFYLAIAFLSDSKKEISSQVYNAAGGVAYLFKNGKGNKGQSFYDLLNGVTEFYTSGDGSGKKVTLWAKAISADFGSAAEKKAEFLKFFQNGDGTLVSEETIFNHMNNGKTLVAAYEAKKESEKTTGASFKPPFTSSQVGSVSGQFTPLTLVKSPANAPQVPMLNSPVIDVEQVD